MEPLFDGTPQELPEQSGATWTVTADDPPPPPPVRHAAGYDAFVRFAARYGTDAGSLLDLWAFAHFIRAHREALEEDPELERSAVVFLGNVLTARDPGCFWTHRTNGLAVQTDDTPFEDEEGRWQTPPDRRYLGVGGTVPAILAADEARFLEFQRVVDAWR